MTVLVNMSFGREYTHKACQNNDLGQLNFIKFLF
jgi:hypothetical protein